MLTPSVLAIYSEATISEVAAYSQTLRKNGMICLLQKMNWEDPTLPLGVTGNTPLIEL